MLVYIVFNTNINTIYGVYEDEMDASYTKDNLNEVENKNDNIIIESFLYKINNTKLNYSEEDTDVDEEDYYKMKDENKNLKDKIQEHDDKIELMKYEYKYLYNHYRSSIISTYIISIIILLIVSIILL